MVILENINNEVVLLEKLICNGTKSMYQELKEKNVGIIDVDFSLMRYLGKELTFKSIIINGNGYPFIKRETQGYIIEHNLYKN